MLVFYQYITKNDTRCNQLSAAHPSHVSFWLDMLKSLDLNQEPICSKPWHQIHCHWGIPCPLCGCQKVWHKVQSALCSSYESSHISFWLDLLNSLALNLQIWAKNQFVWSHDIKSIGSEAFHTLCVDATKVFKICKQLSTVHVDIDPTP